MMAMLMFEESPTVNLRQFDEVMGKEYDLQIDDAGNIWGLVAGDQGYDKTGVTIIEIIGAALCAVDEEGYETHQWPLYTELQDSLRLLIKTARKILASGERS